jgi:hypothetical protein
MSTVPDEGMPAWAIRLEAKLDLATSQQAQRLDNHGETLTDHENRVRGLERDMPHDAHARLRAVEERKTVSPAQLWTVCASGVAALGGGIALVQKIAGS